jgi:hypothetical protein
LAQLLSAEQIEKKPEQANPVQAFLVIFPFSLPVPVII